MHRHKSSRAFNEAVLSAAFGADRIKVAHHPLPSHNSQVDIGMRGVQVAHMFAPCCICEPDGGIAQNAAARRTGESASCCVQPLTVNPMEERSNRDRYRQ